MCTFLWSLSEYSYSYNCYLAYKLAKYVRYIVIESMGMHVKHMQAQYAYTNLYIPDIYSYTGINIQLSVMHVSGNP